MTSHPQVLFRNRQPDRIATLAEYRQSGGYEALRAALKSLSPQAVRQQLLDAMLLGRGGAAFPTGRKLMTVADDAPRPRYLVCNADEMEPGTFKDRVLIHADPHLLIEGMALTAFAEGASHGIVFIRPEYESAARILERETGVARRAGLLGRDILGSGFEFDIVIHRSGGRYICGEGSAQLNALMGRRPNPKQPPPYPTEKGLWGQPTVLQNVETLACVPHIIRNGPQWFKNLAVTDSGAGTKLFCVSGKVRQPGCFELPMGMPLSEIIETHAGGMLPGSEFKACLPGGASTRFMPRSIYDIPMDFESAEPGRTPAGDGGHHGLRPQDLPGGGHFEPDRSFSRGNPAAGAPPAARGCPISGTCSRASKTARRTGIHPHAETHGQAPVEVLLRLCARRGLAAGKPADLLRG